MVEPDGFLIGKLSTCLRTFGDIKQGNQLVQGKQFLLRAGVPSQKSEEIDDSLREIAILTIATRGLARFRVCPSQGEHREPQTVTITFRQLTFTIWLQQQRQMCELGHGVFPAKSAIQHHMQRSRRQPLLTTDNMRNFHQVIVNNICQMIGRQLVSTFVKHLVITDITLDTYLTTNQVIHQYLLSGLHHETNHVLMTRGNQLLHFFFR